MTIVTGVPATRPSSDPTVISGTQPVRSYTMQSLGALVAHVMGAGKVLIPQQLIMETIALGPNTGTYHFRALTNQFSWRRVWLFCLRGATTGILTTASVSINGGATTDIVCPGLRNAVIPVPVFEDISPSQTDTDLYVAISSSATGAVEVQSIGCFEMPCGTLSYVDDSAVPSTMLRPTDPVLVTSVGQVPYTEANTAVGALNAGRRAGMLAFSLAAEGSGLSTASGVAQPVWLAGCEPPQLGRFLYNADTVRGITWRAYYKVTGGATAEFKTTMTNTATSTITGTSASAVWSATGTINVDAEDLSASDGRRSARWDSTALTYRISAGAGTVTLWAVEFYEGLA